MALAAAVHAVAANSTAGDGAGAARVCFVRQRRYESCRDIAAAFWKVRLRRGGLGAEADG